MSGAANHDDFQRCRAERRWKGRLDALFIELCRLAKESRPSADEARAGKGWTWRVLPRGAFVGVRVRTDLGRPQRYELRIARSGELADSAEASWETECRVFLRHLQIRELDGTTPATMPGGCWQRQEPTTSERGKPTRRWIQLMPGEVRPGWAACWDCLQRDEFVEVEHHASFGVTGQRCGDCAMKAGAAERAGS